jgi:hypothetical protein
MSPGAFHMKDPVTFAKQTESFLSGAHLMIMHVFYDREELLTQELDDVWK